MTDQPTPATPAANLEPLSEFIAPMIYAAAQHEDETPVPVTQDLWHTPSSATFAPAPPDLYLTHPMGYVGEQRVTRPVSWALILPGDTVRVEGLTATVGTFWLGSIILSPCPMSRPCGNDSSRNICSGCVWKPEDLTLACTDEIPKHRQGNPAWQWPTTPQKGPTQ